MELRDTQTGIVERWRSKGPFVLSAISATDLFRGHLDLDDDGYVRSKPAITRTSVPGVFASGDVMDRSTAGVVTGGHRRGRWTPRNSSLKPISRRPPSLRCRPPSSKAPIARVTAVRRAASSRPGEGAGTGGIVRGLDQAPKARAFTHRRRSRWRRPRRGSARRAPVPRPARRSSRASCAWAPASSECRARACEIDRAREAASSLAAEQLVRSGVQPAGVSVSASTSRLTRIILSRPASRPTRRGRWRVARLKPKTLYLPAFAPQPFAAARSGPLPRPGSHRRCRRPAPIEAKAREPFIRQ